MKQQLLFCTDCKTNFQWTEDPPTEPGYYWTIYPAFSSVPIMYRVDATAKIINHDKPISEQYWKVTLVVRDWNGKDTPVDSVASIKRGPWAVYFGLRKLNCLQYLTWL